MNIFCVFPWKTEWEALPRAAYLVSQEQQSSGFTRGALGALLPGAVSRRWCSLVGFGVFFPPFPAPLIQPRML